MNAIQLAGLTELIDSKGFDYRVGQNGNNLSGGQIQRIEIARAILAKRPILLAVIEVAHKISDQEKKLFDKIIDLSK